MVFMLIRLKLSTRVPSTCADLRRSSLENWCALVGEPMSEMLVSFKLHSKSQKLVGRWSAAESVSHLNLACWIARGRSAVEVRMLRRRQFEEFFCKPTSRVGVCIPSLFGLFGSSSGLLGALKAILESPRSDSLRLLRSTAG